VQRRAGPEAATEVATLPRLSFTPDTRDIAQAEGRLKGLMETASSGQGFQARELLDRAQVHKRSGRGSI
jgi:hypothetical protein